MLKSFQLVALAAAATALPAMAQVQTGVGVGAGARVDPGRVVDHATSTVGHTVDHADRAVNRTVDRTVNHNHRVATRADLRAGASVRDGQGRRVGTVQSVGANSAVVVQGNRRFQVPLSSLYRSSAGLVTHLSRAQLDASASANARARRR
jgi:hypothetical protein